MNEYRLIPAGPEKPVIYFLSDPDQEEQLPKGPASFVLIQADWDRDLTPWPAPGVFRNQNFTGGAGEYLKHLTGELLPAAEAELGFSPAHRGIIGYSLGGLFALYAFYESACFDLAASVSGSLWYDGWLDYMRTHTPSRPGRVHLSVGDREKKSRNERMKTVEDATREASEILTAQGVETAFVLNPGNHFQDPAARQQRALDWLLEPYLD
ncbi:MAG: alpha/beta hydrolase [Oscillospiraceae bacterium]|nr:alpha/beta hydrolase [Oscillospiraceae bacterium]